MTLFTKFSGKDIIYYNCQGTPTAPKPGRHAVFVGLKECPVFEMPLPPVTKKDRNMLIPQMLPAYYPGSLDGLMWDSMVGKKGASVFLIARELKQKIVKDCGKFSKIHSPGQDLPRREGKIIYQFKNPAGSGLFFFNDGEMDNALYVDEIDTVDQLTSRYIRKGYEVHELNLSMKLSGLFAEKRIFPPSWLLFMGIPILYAFILLFPWQRNRVMADHLKQLEQKKQELTLISQPKENSLPWEEGWEILNQHRSHDIYTWLESLYPVFKNKAKILHFQIQGNQFSITGKGDNALEILKNMIELNPVGQVRLHQIQRTADGEIFKLSGLWK